MATYAPQFEISPQDVEESAVLSQLAILLESPLFRNSKRYPAFLQYVVRESLAGNLDRLKERTIGMEVFHRSPDYDTNAEPVVRVTAAEVRKRIAQFYHDPLHASDLRIDLAPGSYVAQFHTALPVPVFEPPVEAPHVALAESVPLPVPVPMRSARNYWRMATVALLAVIAVAVVAGRNARTLAAVAGSTQSSPMWKGFLATNTPVALVIGMPVPRLPADETHPRPHSEEYGYRRVVAFSDSVAMADLVGMLHAGGATSTVLFAETTNLSELRKRPVILVGAFDNMWTDRVLAGLRFSFERLPTTDGREILQIVDHKAGSTARWSFDNAAPKNMVSRDYALIARFRGETTDGPTIVSAGLGHNGTESAAEFLTSPTYLQQLDAFAPANWADRNMEAVIETEVIDGHAGHPRVVAAEFW